MSDIVKRLRAPAYWNSGSSEGHEGDNSAPLDAAAEIERLRAALREIDTACSNPGSWSPVVMERIIERVQELSRAALEKST